MFVRHNTRDAGAWVFGAEPFEVGAQLARVGDGAVSAEGDDEDGQLVGEGRGDDVQSAVALSPEPARVQAALGVDVHGAGAAVAQESAQESA